MDDADLQKPQVKIPTQIKCGQLFSKLSVFKFNLSFFSSQIKIFMETLDFGDGLGGSVSQTYNF